MFTPKRANASGGQTRGRPYRGNGSSSAPGSGRKRRAQGSYYHDTWYCACKPKLPAKHLQSKTSRNPGRWFFICPQQHDEEQCGFFLWQDEAEAASKRGDDERRDDGREDSMNQYTLGVRDEIPRSPPPVYQSQATPSAKRRFQEEADGGLEDDLGFSLDASEASQLERAIAPFTPRKAIKSSTGATPAAAHEVPKTPLSVSKTVTPASSQPFWTARDRDRDMASPAGSGGKDVGEKLVAEVMGLLRDRRVDVGKETAEALQSTLRRHVLRAQGMARGREIARLALNEKMALVSELQAKIQTLEAELETRKAILDKISWQRETGQFE